MTWSFKLARIAGIDVYVHATFVMLLAWIAVLHWNQGHSLAAVAEGVGYILALFGCVVAHEYGHALTARRYGIRTQDITLLPIGGLARLERMPERPSQELLVALAGPAVNVVIAAVLYAWLVGTGWRDGGDLGIVTGGLAPRIMAANVFLVAFNLLPAFPMDGGRALRALLATRMDYAEATRLAAAIGQGMAMLFGFLGLFGGNPMLIFIALFVWIGAGQEAGMVQMKTALAGVHVRDAMLTHFRSLTPGHTLGDAVDLLLAGSQQDFPVTDDGRVVGMLPRGDLIAALGAAGREALVGGHLRPCAPADADEALEPVLARLQGEACRTVPVMSGGQLVGLLTLENVGELLMVQASDRRHARRP